jgi:putative colanic acid biosynthesis glycosyltransferase
VKKGSRDQEQGQEKEIGQEEPLVTVITVVLNEPGGLKKTIASVREQTYGNLEFIVVDGKSDSPTLEVIRQNEEIIDKWVSEPDRGIYDAMNKGVSLSTGRWIIFLNAGDYFYAPDTVETVFQKDYGDASFIYGHTLFLGGDFNGVVKAWSFDIIWKTMVFTHQSVFTRRDVLERRKFDTRFKICADYNIIYNSYKEGLTFYNSDTVIGAFDPGISELSRARMAYEKWKVVRKHRNDFEFHWFYIKLFINRFFKDLSSRKKKKEKGK